MEADQMQPETRDECAQPLCELSQSLHVTPPVEA
jgi:hypothetical protein